MPGQVGQTIAVIDKSGKVVSTSKHLFGVFNHAKNAYRERKAQIQSERSAKIAEQEALRALQTYTIEEVPSIASSRRSRSRHHSGRSHHHGYYEGPQYEQDLHSVASRPHSSYQRPAEMVRRHTHHDIAVREPRGRPKASRSRSDANVDMDLAYGDFHPSALTRQPSAAQNGQLQKIEDPELNGLVGRAQWLLEEANCVHHSATHTISHLQKNPDAMAAVALTLAEISNLATKMAPAALSALKAAAPSVFALLASPQFLIAAGVGLGATIVMFGGYKIIKQIQGGKNKEIGAPSDPKQQESMDDMMEINTECLSNVEMWRRGVADAEEHSVGTSVDGEFITPTAAAMSGIDITTARMTRDPRFKFDNDDRSMASSRRSRRSHRSRPPRAHSRMEQMPESYVGSKAAPRSFFGGAPKASSRAPSKAESRVSEKGKKPEKKKRSSRLRLMFTT
ncbi:hypothetical protein EYZ11_008201 [Aspergillus tanneri]|uniref:Uncharacterized protein n=1 Tax=Aspergillus tanneri TaxID=1220188 RepID=A0A4S3JBD8_9EURO|nr:uncharacterized protein ATNIH1004_008498 [Aspergillus tanneri]KAA8644297.1 hypothetical protein ATNIH1004_008498 [Aspergillus tanneri]THC92332.1 hypothetical protein EYZ11_008201 [Aspergillus tanneri]